MTNSFINKAIAAIFVLAILVIPATRAHALEIDGGNTGGQDVNTSSGSGSNLTIDGGNTGGQDVTPPSDGTPPGGNPGNTGSIGGGSSFSSGGSSGGSALISGTIPMGTSTLSNSCPLISSTILRRGGNNNQAEVAKLQAYLKTSESMDVSVTGTFDIQTELAVRTFQKKYTSDILLPWGGTKTSGIVYITTSKKINQLACAQPIVLSAADLVIINNFRARLDSTSNDTAFTDSLNVSVIGTTSTPTATSTGNIFGSVDENSNVADAADASIASRFWNYIVNLFR